MQHYFEKGCHTTKSIKMKQLFAFTLALILLVLNSCDKELNSGFNGGDFYQNVGKADSIIENPFIKTTDSATSTFSIDADGASYALTRRLVTSSGIGEYKDALRTEELINYFTFDYPKASLNENISVNGEVSICPWKASNKIIRIGLKGKSVALAEYPIANFVLLIDVSGSMSSPDKLELLKSGFIKFTEQMRPEDRIAIVTYAGSDKVALESTPGSQKNKIITAIQNLGSGGSTNGEAGIKKAYEIAQNNFIAGGNNRVILGTDGDFNVGISSTEQLISLIEQKRNSGIFLTALGVGLGNLNESMLEKIANKGNGNFEYIDNKEEMEKVFIHEYNKFLTVAKDVKVQITFNKDIVEEYRLIGYENRVLQNSDFKDDLKDAGEIGAGQTITAIYEIKPKANVDFKTNPSFTILFRYKKPDEITSRELSLNIYDIGQTFDASSESMRFSASLASLGLYLRNSQYKGNTTIEKIRDWASSASTYDPNGYRQKHISLLQKIH